MKKANLNQTFKWAMKILPILLQIGLALPVLGQPYYVAPTGSDGNAGTLEKPFATIQHAQQMVRQKPGSVVLRGGTYYLPQKLVFNAEDSGSQAAPVFYQAYGNEQPVISGGVRLEKLDWQPYRDGIVQAKVPEDLQTEEIFVNGERQILARYPDYDPKAQYFDGFAADAISPERVARWADPAGGYFHAMHPALWGDFTWRITGKDPQGGLTKEGGWQNNRGGAVFCEGIEDCALEDCFLDQVGGNAIFVNHYNRRLTIRGCHIAKAGASGICFVGDPHAARNPLFNYSQVNKLEDLDRTPGPRPQNYPADWLVEDCLIYLTGRVEKQTAGVDIDLAQNITVRHCSIYDMPRAGINIGDGCWGGHVIEFCDVFDTVKETGDHGSFNSWGRDRYWGLKDIDLNTITTGPNRNLPLADVIEPNILRNNRLRCDHGWDIDLDDGSSNYHLYNNLALNGGIKLREGFFRTAENNIMV